MNLFASKIFCAALMCMSVFSLSASVSKTIENISVRTMLISSVPEVRYSGSLQIPSVSGRFTNSWLAIVVEYTPKFKDQSGKGRSSAADAEEFLYQQQRFLDNVEVKVQALCEAVGANGAAQYALFSGSAQLWHIKLDGVRHCIMFFVPPWMTDRYYYPHSKLKSNRDSRAKRNDVRKLSKESVNRITRNDLKIEVTFNVNNSVLASAYANVTNTKKNPARGTFGKMLTQVPANYRFKGGVLSKGQSPWAYMDINLFDPEKPLTDK